MEIQPEKQAYRQLFNATFIFGGLQVFTILIGLIRNKFVAVLLGPSGSGFMSLLNTNLGLIAMLTGLGIGFSAVRDISIAFETNDQIKLSTTLKTFRRWVWFTGLLGMITIIVLSSWLNKLSFGNQNYIYAFLLISITLLINAISAGQSTVLKGTRRVKDMAKAGIWGATLGLVTTVPFYYFYGINGIVPAAIVTSFFGLLISWYFSRKVKTVPVQLSYKESYVQGKEMAKLGIMLTLHYLIGYVVGYLVNIFISHKGGMSQVGLYNSGWNITNQYVGLVFTAMNMDYYPRLAGVHSDNVKVKELVNQQAEIATLIIAPIMLLFLVSLPVLVPLLYSKEFLPIIPYTRWMVIGMLFKAASWTMSFVALAKGDSKFYFWFESIFGNTILLITCIGGYYFWGLEGSGIAFLIFNVVYFISLAFLCRKRFDVNFTDTFFKIFIIQLLMCLLAFLCSYFLKGFMEYFSGSIVLIISSLYSYKELNERIDVKDFLLSKIRRK